MPNHVYFHVKLANPIPFVTLVLETIEIWVIIANVNRVILRILQKNVKNVL